MEVYFDNNTKNVLKKLCLASLLTGLLRIVGELAKGGYVAVAVGGRDR